MEHQAFGYDKLLETLKAESPVQVEVLKSIALRVDYGLLPVGFKLHFLKEFPTVMEFVEKLGGEHYRGGERPYAHVDAISCLVLPPFGNVRAATMLLDCIERSTGLNIFNNREIQIQVCTPGRLVSRSAAVLSSAFYLGSDVVRRYELKNFETTFSDHKNFPKLKRGRRITIYDGLGALVREFEYWGLGLDLSNNLCLMRRQELPFLTQRTDILTAQTRIDVQNINLIATLLVHMQERGYWHNLGSEFMTEFENLLERHLLSGILEVAWIRTIDESSFSDEPFYTMLNELTNYALDEYARAERLKRRKRWLTSPRDDILSEMRVMLQKYRDRVIRQARAAIAGEIS